MKGSNHYMSQLRGLLGLDSYLNWFYRNPQVGVTPTRRDKRRIIKLIGSNTYWVRGRGSVSAFKGITEDVLVNLLNTKIHTKYRHEVSSKVFRELAHHSIMFVPENTLSKINAILTKR